MAVSLEQFTKALVDAGLCAADEVPSLIAGCSSAGQPPNAETLARKLIGDKRLTAFQAQQALAGRGLAMGEYVIVDRIGAGGMGQVFKAQHRRMKRVVALKVMSPAAMKDAAAVKRFQREVEAAARLVHPNIVTAFDAGEHRATHFLVMEFVDGGDLSALVKKQGRLPVDKAIDYTLQAARGLAFAHAEHVIHRDIKPANLLVDKKGVVKILDMGLARFDDGGEGLTGTEQVMGTVDYMSPEQAAQTKGVDARADIYSLGCTLWYLLTASKLYDGETLISRMLKHREEPIPSLMQQRDDVPWGLEQLFRRMVGKRTEDRPQSMDEVVAELEKLRGQSSGVNLAGGAEAGDAALSNFLSGIGKSGGRSSSAPGASGPSLASAASTRQTTTGDEATSALSRAEIGTDPKSELHLRAAPRAAGSKQTGSGKPAAGRAAPRGPVSVPLVVGGAAVSVVLVATGVWIALGGWVIVRDPQGNEIARVQVPEGGTVTVVTSPPAATPPVIRPLAPRTGTGPAATAAAPPTSTTPAVTGAAPPPTGTAFALGPATAAARRDTGSVELPRFVRASDPLTVEMWVRPRSAAPAGESRGLWTLAGVLELKQHTEHWVWQRNNRQQAPHLEQVSAPLGSAGSPVHLAAVSTGAELQLFVAGQLVGSRTLVNPLPDNLGLPQALAPWGGTSTYRPFDGTIDEVRISKVARYDNAFTPATRLEPDADTLALYHCDEGTGDVLGDASGHGHNGTIVGVAWVRADTAAIPSSPLAGAGPGVSGPAPAASTLDLLATFDPARSLVGAADQANWQRAGTELTFTGRGQAGLVKFPYPLADRYYRLEIEFTRTAGGGGFNIDLPLKAGMFTVNLDERGRTGLARTGQATRTERIETGRRYRVAVTMAREGTADRIALELDGRPILAWTGDRQQVVNAPWKEPASDDTQRAGLWIPPGESRFTFHRATVTWLDEVATSPPAPPATGAAATPTGSASAPRTPAGYALDLSGTGDGESQVFVDKLPVSTAGKLTAECWVVPRGAGEPQINYPLVNLGGHRFALKQYGRRWVFNCRRGSTKDYDNLSTTVDVVPGQAAHLAAVADGREMRLYVQGKLAGRMPLTVPFEVGDYPMVLGGAKAERPDWDLFDGLIDEVRISSTARYSGDFTPVARFEPDAHTLALYHCDEGTGNVLVDSSGHGRSGRIKGATWARFDSTAVSGAGSVSSATAPAGPTGTGGSR